jgi:hypothetical protein
MSWVMKARLPRFLVLRRRYEVDRSHWLVKYGPQMAGLPFVTAGTTILLIVREGEKGVVLLTNGGRKALPSLGASGQKGAIHLTNGGGRVLSGLTVPGRKVVLFVQWRRMPKEWEVSFVRKMKSMEAQGIRFPEVLKLYLPSIIGEAPSEVLLRWVGRQTRLQPKRFANAARKMFGKSSKSIITGLENLADPEKIMADRMPVEPPYQSLVDAIKAADGD